MKTSLLGILLLTVSLWAEAQALREQEAFNTQLLEALVKAQVDSIRRAGGYTVLKPSKPLEQAARHHSSYMLKYGKLSHYEPMKATRNPMRRVIYYGAELKLTGENVLQCHYGSPVMDRDKNLYSTATYGQLAHAIAMGWSHSPGHLRNILTRDYELTGIAAAVDPASKTLYITQVFGRASDSIKRGGLWTPPLFSIREKRLFRLRGNSYITQDKENKKQQKRALGESGHITCAFSPRPTQELSYEQRKHATAIPAESSPTALSAAQQHAPAFRRAYESTTRSCRKQKAVSSPAGGSLIGPLPGKVIAYPANEERPGRGGY